MSAIRIIRAELTMPPDISALQRQEYIHMVGSILAAAKGPDGNIAEFAEKLNLLRTGHPQHDSANGWDEVAENVERKIRQNAWTKQPKTVHADFELHKVLELLELDEFAR